MNINEKDLRRIIREELIRENFAGETEPKELVASLHSAIADWAVNRSIDPSVVVRELINDVSNAKKKRRSRFTRDPEYRQFVDQAKSLGIKAVPSLEQMRMSFKQNDPSSSKNVERSMKWSGTGFGGG